MITPAALRSMRGALDWSMRDLASAAGVSLATVLKAEHAGGITATTERRLRAAMAARGVTVQVRGDSAQVKILQAPHSLKSRLPGGLAGLEYVSVRPRTDGTYRVLFEVPARLRPVGWPGSRPLPLTYPRRGDLSDAQEVEAIQNDAKQLLNRLRRIRAKGAH